MDKSQALQNFWESFELPAYDENSVPDDAEMPYITYSVGTDSIDSPLSLAGTLWYYSTNWRDISRKSEEIAKVIAEHGFYSKKINNGYLWITKGTPFAQRMGSDKDPVKRIYMNITVEFLTAY